MDKINLDDPRICIDCTGFSTEKKKRVQDALFKLGYKWYGNETYKSLEEDRYINFYDAADIRSADGSLMHSSALFGEADKVYQHTYEQLLERAGTQDTDDIVLNQVTKDLLDKHSITLDYNGSDIILWCDMWEPDALVIKGMEDLLKVCDAMETLNSFSK